VAVLHGPVRWFDTPASRRYLAFWFCFSSMVQGASRISMGCHTRILTTSLNLWRRGCVDEPAHPSRGPWWHLAPRRLSRRLHQRRRQLGRRLALWRVARWRSLRVLRGGGLRELRWRAQVTSCRRRGDVDRLRAGAPMACHLTRDSAASGSTKGTFLGHLCVVLGLEVEVLRNPRLLRLSVVVHILQPIEPSSSS